MFGIGMMRWGWMGRRRLVKVQARPELDLVGGDASDRAGSQLGLVSRCCCCETFGGTPRCVCSLKRRCHAAIPNVFAWASVRSCQGKERKQKVGVGKGFAAVGCGRLPLTVRPVRLLACLCIELSRPGARKCLRVCRAYASVHGSG